MKQKKSMLKLALKVINEPLLLHRDAHNIIIRVINNALGVSAVSSQPAAEGKDLAGFFQMEERAQRLPMDGLAIIPVYDVLSYRPSGFFSFFFGGTSYEEIRDEFRAAVNDPNVKAIVFDIDSPGGEVAGVFDLVDEIYQARGTKPIYAVANEDAYSAAYAIASAADKIFLSRTGEVGSIGVMAMHLDESGWDAQEGLKYTAIYAGARKNDFNPHEPLSAEAHNLAQADVNAAYDLFVETVARNRGMKAADVRATEAGTFKGKKAVDAGLADAVLPWDKAILEIVSENKRQGGLMKALVAGIKALLEKEPVEKAAAALLELGFIPKPAEGAQAPPVPDMEKIRALIATGLNIKPEQVAGDLAVIDFTAVRKSILDAAGAELAVEAIAIVDICAEAGMEKMAAGFIHDKIKPEAARQKILEAKATAAETTAVRSTVGALGTGEVNPLLADAKKRAEASAKKSH